MNDIDTRIRKTMASVFGVAESAITDTSSPQTISSWDSLNHVHLVMALEGEFGVTFEADQALSLTSIAAIRKSVGG